MWTQGNVRKPQILIAQVIPWLVWNSIQTCVCLFSSDNKASRLFADLPSQCESSFQFENPGNFRAKQAVFSQAWKYARALLLIRRSFYPSLSESFNDRKLGPAHTFSSWFSTGDRSPIFFKNALLLAQSRCSPRRTRVVANMLLTLNGIQMANTCRTRMILVSKERLNCFLHLYFSTIAQFQFSWRFSTKTSRRSALVAASAHND